MQTAVLAIDPNAPDPVVLARAAGVLRAGGLVAFPTETVYGLGADALIAEAVGRVFTAKGRPANNPLIVHVADEAGARAVAGEWPEAAARLAARFWPGPLTLVVPKAAAVPAVVTAGGPTVAVRVPAHPVALALLRAAGVPLAAPSANRSSQLSPTRAEHVLRGLAGRIDLVLDGGPTTGGLESTVLDVTSTPPRLLRPGLIGPADLEAVIGPVTCSQAAAGETAGVLPSPGMMRRHYAPRKPLECVEGDSLSRVEELAAAGERVGWLVFGRSYIFPTNVIPFPTSVYYGQLPSDPTACAAQLYDLLHHLDKDVPVTRIVVELPPDTPEWLAVRDRLRRASA
jgi:L-threonylcarbamoyladenylate synthase